MPTVTDPFAVEENEAVVESELDPVAAQIRDLGFTEVTDPEELKRFQEEEADPVAAQIRDLGFTEVTDPEELKRFQEEEADPVAAQMRGLGFTEVTDPTELEVMKTQDKRLSEAEIREKLESAGYTSGIFSGFGGDEKFTGVRKGFLERTKDALNSIGRDIANEFSKSGEGKVTGVAAEDKDGLLLLNPLIGKYGSREEAKKYLFSKEPEGVFGVDQLKNARAVLNKQDAEFEAMGITDPKERERYFKDAIKEKQWTAEDKDTVRKLSTGEIRINPAHIFGRRDELVKEITKQADNEADAKEAIGRLDSMRNQMAAAKAENLWYADKDYQAVENRMENAGITDKAAILDAYSAQQRKRGNFEKLGDMLISAWGEAGTGIAKTAVGTAAGIAALVGDEPTAAELGGTQRMLGEAISGSQEASNIRGLTGGFQVGKDLISSGGQMAPMLIGGWATAGLKGMAGAAAQGMAVYGTSAAQGYESKLADAVAFEQEKYMQPMTEAQIAEVLSRPETQTAAWLNAAQTALLSKVMGGGAERAALGKAAQSMTVRDFITGGGMKALKDGTLRKELGGMLKTIRADYTDEMAEEAANTLLDGAIDIAVLDQEMKLGDLLSEAAYGGFLGGPLGGLIPQGMRGRTATDAGGAGATAPVPEPELKPISRTGLARAASQRLSELRSAQEGTAGDDQTIGVAGRALSPSETAELELLERATADDDYESIAGAYGFKIKPPTVVTPVEKAVDELLPVGESAAPASVAAAEETPTAPATPVGESPTAPLQPAPVATEQPTPVATEQPTPVATEQPTPVVPAQPTPAVPTQQTQAPVTPEQLKAEFNLTDEQATAASEFAKAMGIPAERLLVGSGLPQTAATAPESVATPTQKENLPEGSVVFSDVYKSEGNVTIIGKPFIGATGGLEYPAMTKGGRSFNLAAKWLDKVISTPSPAAPSPTAPSPPTTEVPTGSLPEGQTPTSGDVGVSAAPAAEEPKVIKLGSVSPKYRDAAEEMRERLGNPVGFEEDSRTIVTPEGVELEISHFGQSVRLNSIAVPSGDRKQGLASKAMQDLVDLADEMDVALKLGAKPFGRSAGMSQAQLVKWYQKFGFEVGADGETMIRQPNKIEKVPASQTAAPQTAAPQTAAPQTAAPQVTPSPVQFQPPTEVTKITKKTKRGTPIVTSAVVQAFKNYTRRAGRKPSRTRQEAAFSYTANKLEGDNNLQARRDMMQFFTGVRPRVDSTVPVKQLKDTFAAWLDNGAQTLPIKPRAAVILRADSEKVANFKRSEIFQGIQSYGGIMSFSEGARQGKTEKNSSEWNDAPEIKDPQLSSLIYNPTGGLPSSVAQFIYDNFPGALSEPTAKALWAAVDAETTGASKLAKQESAEETRLEQGEAFTIASEIESDNLIAMSELQVGDRIVMDGEELEVTSRSYEDGYVKRTILKGGKRFGTQVIEGDIVLPVESVEIGERAANTGFLDEEDMGENAMELETQTPESIEAERVAKETRDRIAAQQARPLAGSAGDLTADMFGEGETPLFNERRDTTPKPTETPTEETPKVKLSESALKTLARERSLMNLAGDRNAVIRATILSELTGAKVPKSKAGINALEKALGEYFGIDPNTVTRASFDDAVMNAVRAELNSLTTPPIRLSGFRQDLKEIAGFISEDMGEVAGFGERPNRVVTPDGVTLELEGFGNAITLLNIETPEGARGQGLATKTMQKLIAEADKYGVALRVVAEPFGRGDRMTKDQLMSWYGRFGFESEEGSDIMIRQAESNERFQMESDAAYLAAVERGDMETAQRMVDDVATAVGYQTVLHHGTPRDLPDVFDRKAGNNFWEDFESWGVWATQQKESAAQYGDPKTFYADLGQSLIYRGENAWAEWAKDFAEIAYPGVSIPKGSGARAIRKIVSDFLDSKLAEYNRGKPKGAQIPNHGQSKKGRDWVAANFPGADGYNQYLKDRGYGSVQMRNAIVDGREQNITVVLESNQLKSADPVTYDADGNVIPLSERFNPESPDIRYQMDTASPESIRHAELEAKFNAGTITLEETAEAQALVEKAARAAGYDVKGWHSSKSAQQFNSFDPTKQSFKDFGFFFSNKETTRYGKNVKPFYLKVTKPLTLPKDAGVITQEKIEGEVGTGQTAVRLGYDGILNPAMSEIVVFSPEQIKSAETFTGVPLDQRFNPISPDIRYQNLSQRAKGSTTFNKDGTITIRGNKEKADFSTIMHELMHAFEGTGYSTLSDSQVEELKRWAGEKGITKENLRDRMKSEAASEKLARGWESYIASGRAPLPSLQAIFDKMAKWMLDIYGKIQGSDIDVEVPANIRAIFDSMAERIDPAIIEKMQERVDNPSVIESKNGASIYTEDGSPLPPAIEPTPENIAMIGDANPDRAVELAIGIARSWMEEVNKLPKGVPIPEELPPPDDDGVYSINEERRLREAKKYKYALDWDRAKQTFGEAMTKAFLAEEAHEKEGLPENAASALLARLEQEGELAAPLKDEQIALLVIESLNRKTDLDKALKGVAKAMESGSASAIEEALRIHDEADFKYQQILLMSKRAGAASGRSLNAWKIAVQEDFSPASLVTRELAKTNAILLKNGKEALARLPEDEFKQIMAYSEKMLALQAQEKARLERDSLPAEERQEYEDRLAEQDALIEELLAEKAQSKKGRAVQDTTKRTLTDRIKKAAAEARERLKAAGEPVTRYQLEPDAEDTAESKARWFDKVLVIAEPYIVDTAMSSARFADIVRTRLGQSMVAVAEKLRIDVDRYIRTTEADITGKEIPSVEKIQAELNPEIPVTREMVYELAKAHVFEGARKSEVMDRVTATLQTMYPDITRDEVSQLFTDYGKQTGLKSDELAKALRTAKSIELVQKQIDDLTKRKTMMKTGRAKDDADIALRELRKKRDDLAKSIGYNPTDPKTQLASAQSAAKRRMENEIAELQKAIDSGNPRVRVRRGVEYTEDMKVMRERLTELRESYNTIFGRERTDAERNAMLIKDLDRRIAKEEDLISKGLLAEPVSGQPAFTESPEVLARREKLAELRQQNRDLHAPEIALKKAMDAAQKAVQRRLDTVVRRGAALPKKPSTEPTVSNADLDLLWKAADAMDDYIKELRKNLPLTPAQEAKAMQDAYDRAVQAREALKQRIAKGEIEIQKPARKIPLEERTRLVRQENAELQKQITQMQKDAKLGQFSDEAKEARRVGGLQARIAEIRRKRIAQDYEKKPRVPPVTSVEISELELDMAFEKRKYDEERAESLYKKLSGTKQFLTQSDATLKGLTLLNLSGDVGIENRQLGFGGATLKMKDFKYVLKTLTSGKLPKVDETYIGKYVKAWLTAFKNPRFQTDVFESIFRAPNYAARRKRGFKLLDPHDTTFEVNADNTISINPLKLLTNRRIAAFAAVRMIIGTWAKLSIYGWTKPSAILEGIGKTLLGTFAIMGAKGIVQRMEAANATILNMARWDLQDLAEAGFSKDGVSEVQYEETMDDLTKLTMLATGQFSGTSDVSKLLERNMAVLGRILRFPNHNFSKASLALLTPFFRIGFGAAANKRFQAKKTAAMYGNYLAVQSSRIVWMAFVFGAISALKGGDDEEDEETSWFGVVTDPRSPHFGAVKIGPKTFIDITATQSKWWRFMARMTMDETLDRKVLADGWVVPKKVDSYDQKQAFQNFTTNMLNPNLSRLLNVAFFDRFYEGGDLNKMNWPNRIDLLADDAMMNLTAKEMMKNFEEHGLVEGILISRYLMFGDAVTIREDSADRAEREAKEAERFTEFED